MCLTAVLGKLAYRAFVKYMRDRYGRGLDILPIDPDSFEEALGTVFRKSAPVIEEVLVKTLKSEFSLDDVDGTLGLIISEIDKKYPSFNVLQVARLPSPCFLHMWRAFFRRSASR